VTGDYRVESIRARLSTSILGRSIHMHRQVGSTNDLVKDAGRLGADEGLVVLAEEQVRGRGRLGRTWTAPAGSSILCSVLLRPRFSPQQAFYLTIAASLAILRGVRELAEDRGQKTDVGLEEHNQGEGRVPVAAIKWPNDVLVNGRKVAGVLSEGEFVGGEWAFATVGFGVNVNLSGVDLEGLRLGAPRATSLSAEWGVEIDRAGLLARILEELEGLYLALQNGQFGVVHEEWVSKLETIGRRVLVEQGTERISGVAVRVDGDGALVVKREDRSEVRVLAGDVI
jgi:BirA family biotin operon repressor/biotin-[acetyl-CoA-carboxylase] ligase